MAQQTPLWNEIMRIRDAERDRIANSKAVVDGETAAREVTPMGIVRWYIHPLLEEPAIRTYFLWMHEIPPGSRTGRIKHQGGRVHYVWKGRGHTVVDGVSHDWEEGSVIALPIKDGGIEYQHFNTGDEDALLLTAELNLASAMGMEWGAQFEVVEPCPEYRA
ncbi:MAG TPA: cupin domain-containing protein [Dehalococcoidia bacterium]|nr:cupin domain-containing protein [Dehalococcoidia bacterium]